jgi:hypothetical protein
MLLIFVSRLAKTVLDNFTISLRVVKEVWDSGIKAVLMKENMRCMIFVAGLISNM